MTIGLINTTGSVELFTFDNLTHTMVAGLQGAFTGKFLAFDIGSIVPIAFPDVFGRAIFNFGSNDVGAFEIAMDSGLGLAPDFWKVLKIESTDANWNRKEFTFDQFAFETNGITFWRLAGQPSFLNGVTYRLDWT